VFAALCSCRRRKAFGDAQEKILVFHDVQNFSAETTFLVLLLDASAPLVRAPAVDPARQAVDEEVALVLETKTPSAARLASQSLP
jgi:hypothetical protein